ncbi:YD repeat-containing protein [Pedobacter westerhofensis]|uniref:YD repeat-containing protein n=1 Tax=Pedobacter westerhofensis TaxID=425512 RepID=A0A521C7S7_9SPHI|nr:hypothetical protein [Pedobacter westerhofensis]SMO55425.1 YD repeat-containing protein [Pedobacter westerhofensis]
MKMNCSTTFSFDKSLLYLHCFLTLFLLETYCAQSQTVPIPSREVGTAVIPPSPDAMALGKYGLIPVSLYTGVPDIAINLGTAEGKDISVPISLNYHNNGLKSFEKASSVGLGWTLNAGGVITRIIRDKVDELTPSQYRYDHSIDNYSASGNVNLENVQVYLEGATYFGTYDTEPDIYVYNFGEYSGSFMFFKDKIYQFPYRKLKITGTSSGPFTITTEKGNVYTFSTTETSTPKNSSTSSYSIPTHISSWYLTSIQPPDKKEIISFSYAGGDPIIMHGSSSQSYLKKAIGNSVLEQKSSSLPTTINAIHLSSISTSKMTVNFNTQTVARTDIDGNAYAIDNVSFVNNLGSTINKFKFNYGYFGAGHMLASPLKLLNVIEDYENSKKTHSFEYNDAATFPVLTDAVDHWGYVNGSTSPNIIIPNTIVNGGANREPSGSLLGMLTKVTYPTGGETRFEYEPNMYFTGKNYVQKATTVAGDLFRSNASDNTLLLYSNTFKLAYKQDVTVSYRRNPKEATSSDPNAPNGPNALTKNIEPEVTITPVDGTSGVTRKFLINYNYQNSGILETVNLPAGDYQIDVKCDSKELSVNGYVGYSYSTNIPIEGVAGPGQRIKRILSFSNTPGQTSPSLTKSYSYVDDLGFSTGVLVKGVDYLTNPSYKVVTYSLTLPSNDEYQVYSSSISATLSDLLNQEMYYKQVDENDVSAVDTLKSRSKFISYLNAYDYLMTDVRLSEKTDYKKTSSGYSAILKNQYTYGLKLDTVFSALKPIQTIQAIVQSGAGPERMRNFNWKWYQLYPSAWVYNTSNTITSYADSDSTIVRNTFVNDIRKTHNLLQRNEELSNGYQRLTKYKYPENYSSRVMGSLLDAHVVSPVIEQQSWLKKSATDSVLTAGTITEYDNSVYKPKNEYKLELTSPSAGPNQESITADGFFDSIISDSKYVNRAQYTYDSNSGNILSQDLLNRSSEQNVSYIWGYDGNYPIAKCFNGAPSDFKFLSFEEGGNGTIAGSGHTGSHYYSGDYSLNFSLPNSAKKYLYSFWYLQSGKWVFSGESEYTGPTTLTLGDAIDDVKIYPNDGQMSTYTYYPGVGLTSSTDVKDNTTFYQYDASQRLINILDQNGNIIKNIDYHYRP